MIKKMGMLAISIGIILYASGCGANEAPVFEENKSHFSAVAEFALDHYSNVSNTNYEHLTLTFSDGNITDSENLISLSEEISQSVENIEKAQFDFLWVGKDYVIFWQDETKYYGLLWAENPKSVIKTIKEDWYNGMESQKIESNWYEIGVLNAI